MPAAAPGAAVAMASPGALGRGVCSVGVGVSMVSYPGFSVGVCDSFRRCEYRVPSNATLSAHAPSVQANFVEL